MKVGIAGKTFQELRIPDYHGARWAPSVSLTDADICTQLSHTSSLNSGPLKLSGVTVDQVSMEEVVTENSG